MNSPRKYTPISFREKIPSRIDEVDRLCLKIRHLLQTNNLGEYCFSVELLARECLNNAVIHGNQKDADKSIVLCLSVGRAWIRLQVSDDGPGFAWRKARSSKLDTAACSGRGLQFYELYAERAQFNRSGNQITLWIRKSKRRGKEDGTMSAYVLDLKDQKGSVKLKGDLTAVLVPDLQAGLKEMLNVGVREVEFDLASTKMLDSSGMGLLIAAANSLATHSGKVYVTNVSPDIFRLLQSMRLTARLNVSGKAE
jgi:serine/threonine-protein kinase RsbW